MKNNMSLNKILLPKVFLLAVIVTAALGTDAYVAQKTQKQTINTNKQNILLFGCVSAVIILFGLTTCYNNHKNKKRFSMLVARKYLSLAMKNQPELKIFEQVLSNPQALKNVSAVIFNSMRPSEQKQISQIIMNLHKNLAKNERRVLKDMGISKDTTNFVYGAQRQILAIIQNHAVFHPEFAPDVYSALARADMIYIVQKKLHQQNTK